MHVKVRNLERSIHLVPSSEVHMKPRMNLCCITPAQVVEIGQDDGSGRGPKISCSIKLVDQTSGEDLDPNGLRWVNHGWTVLCLFVCSGHVIYDFLNFKYSRYKPRGDISAGGRPGATNIGATAGAVVKGKIDWGYLAGDNKLYVVSGLLEWCKILQREFQFEMTLTRGIIKGNMGL